MTEVTELPAICPAEQAVIGKRPLISIIGVDKRHAVRQREARLPPAILDQIKPD